MRKSCGGWAAEIRSMRDYGMIEGYVYTGQSAATGRAIKEIDFRCKSGIGTAIIHGMNYLDRRDLRGNPV